MIAPPQDCNAHLASAWTTGIALVFLGIGMHGAATPLMPEGAAPVTQMVPGAEVLLEEFTPPAAFTADQARPESEEPVEQIEIPPLPEITAPLTPPEMAELTPLEPIIEKTTPPVVKPPGAKPEERRPATQPRPESTPGGGGAPAMFTGGGSGRFSPPYYPASARSAGLQGSLRLLVTVEASGLPSAVTVTASSGHAILDSAARDHVQRRWRWPAGEVRRYIVPIRFVLQ